MADAIEKGAMAGGGAESIGNIPESSMYGGETLRDKARGALFNLGLDRRAVNTLIGDMRADSIIDNVGLVDLTTCSFARSNTRRCKIFKERRLCFRNRRLSILCIRDGSWI